MELNIRRELSGIKEALGFHTGEEAAAQTRAEDSMVYDVPFVRSFRELLAYDDETYGERVAFTFRGSTGYGTGVSSRESNKVAEITYSSAIADVKALTSYFHSLGLPVCDPYPKNEGHTPKPHVAIFGRNCYEWALTYLTVACGVGVVVPVDKELKAPDVEYILTKAEASCMVYADDEKETVEALTKSMANPPRFIAMSTLSDALAAGNALRKAGDTSYESYRVDADEMSVLLFTSGTTGMAKGVMLSQHNVCADMIAMRKRIKILPDDRVFSVLPLHHTYECTAGFLTVLYSGASIAYNESIRRIMNDLALFRPTVLVAVPLLLENIHSNIIKKIKKDRAGSVKLALGLGAAKLSSQAGKLAFAQIHEAFGGRLHIIICGAAALSPKIFSDLSDFGFNMYAGYGLTETSPVCIMHNDFIPHSADSIGAPIAGVKVRLIAYNGQSGASDGRDAGQGEVGEIAIRGENVMLGYYKDEEATARAIIDGWFCTGDLGMLDETGCYRIVGRIKNVIVTKNGKKIFPEEMEYRLESSPLIRESVVYGSEDATGEMTVCAKIFPDYAEVNRRLAEKKLLPQTELDAAKQLLDDMTAGKIATGERKFSEAYTAALQELLREVVRDINHTNPAYKMIRQFHIRMTEFTKTTTKKIKRNADESESDYLV